MLSPFPGISPGKTLGEMGPPGWFVLFADNLDFRDRIGILFLPGQGRVKSPMDHQRINRGNVNDVGPAVHPLPVRFCKILVGRAVAAFQMARRAVFAGMQKALFMISEDTVGGQLPGHFEDSAAIGAPVDQVPDKNDPVLCLGLERFEQNLQLVDTTMDIPDKKGAAFGGGKGLDTQGAHWGIHDSQLIPKLNLNFD